MKRYLCRKRDSFVIRFFVLFFFAAGCIVLPISTSLGTSDAGYVYQMPARINDGWETASIHKMHVDAEKLIDLIRSIRNGSYENIHSVLLVKDGKLILEEYFHGFHREKVHQIRSVNKSIGSILTGIAIDHAFIKGTGELMYPYFKEYEQEKKWDERVRKVTLETLLTMTSGYACDDHATPVFQCEKAMYAADDWLEYSLNLPMAYDPGEHWAYNSTSLILVSELISKTSKMSIPDFADTYLLSPLMIKEFHWAFSPKGRAWIAGNAKMKPRDMAKIGLLMLQGGRWNNKRIVSEKWVNESTREHVESEKHGGYGYLWWTGKQQFGEQTIEAYWAEGNGGNYIFVCPALNFTAVFTGGNYNSILELQPLGMLINYIIPAMLPPMPPREIAKQDSMVPDSYVGEYQLLPGDIRIAVFKKNNRLYCSLLGRTIQMHPEEEDHLFVPDNVLGDWTFKVQRDEKGEVDSAILYAAFRNMPLKKIR